MKLYLVRHGEAAWTEPDSERALTVKGQENSSSLFERYHASWNEVNHVWVSPYRRAQETYQLLGPFVTVNTLQTTSRLLTPDISPVTLLTDLANVSWEEKDALVLVAHNPLLSKLLNLLTGKPNGFYQLGTSGIAALELSVMSAGCAELLWIEIGY